MTRLRILVCTALFLLLAPLAWLGSETIKSSGALLLAKSHTAQDDRSGVLNSENEKPQVPGRNGVTLPVCTYTPTPPYTKEAMKAKFDGTLLVEVEGVVGLDGGITNLRVVKSPGLGLDKSAINTLKKWKCRPGKDRHGRPVTTLVPFQFSFHLDDTGNAHLLPHGTTVQQEQSSFGTEEVPDEPFVKQPVPLPDAASEILKGDDGVKSCLEDNPLRAGKQLSSWFIASEIHLDGTNEADLVVLANPQVGDSYPCFHSVEGVSWFWIFRQAGRRYELVLKAAGNGLDVLKARNNGYRNLQTGTIGQAGRFVTTATYRFDGKRYQKYRESTQEQH